MGAPKWRAAGANANKSDSAYFLLVSTIKPEYESEQSPNKDPNQDPQATPDNLPIKLQLDESFIEQEDVSRLHPELTKDEHEIMLLHLWLSHLPFIRLWITTIKAVKDNPPQTMH